ncbi:maestro heat-like repeat-containing protein family member 2B [Struthio camelus]|uniref:maestro heat-like repeat-containing protein family member 2B n=1 Tax=Struthio camelus TaxID=8801 RepID=UPI003603E6CC
MKRFLFFGGCLSKASSRVRPQAPEDGGRGTESLPAAISTLAASVASLLSQLQENEGNRVETYRTLVRVLQEDGTCLESTLLRQLITRASRDMRVGQGATDELQRAASDILVSLAPSHFLHVMDELQSHLKPVEEIPEECVFTALSKLATSYALRCIPFVEVTWGAMHTLLNQADNSSRIKQAFCGVLESWSKGVTLYFQDWAKCSFPRMGEAQFCDRAYPLYCYVISNWLTCEEEELKQAIIRTVAAMMGLLLHKEEYQEHVCSQVSWLLGQYEEVQDSSHVTKSLSHFLEGVAQFQLCLPKGTVSVICVVVHSQLSDGTKEHSTDHKMELSYCMLLLARISPDDTMEFLYAQLGIDNEASRTTALYLLRALVRCDPTRIRTKMRWVVRAMESVFGDHRSKVKAAVLSFIKELFSSGVENCSAWGLVAYVFSEFSRATSRLETSNLSETQALEESTLQSLCLQVLHSLDVSGSGMTTLLWPRLLQYVVPAQYTGTLIPLSRCLGALVERQERRSEDKEEPSYLGYQERAKLPTPQALLVRLLVLARFPFEGGGYGVAALQLLKALHRAIHRAVGLPWTEQIPSLLHYLEGKDESSLDCVEWERLLLKFLRTSLETIENQAWLVHLNVELAQQMAKYPNLSKEKSFLYKAVGTALAASQSVTYVQEQMQSYLERLNSWEPSETEGAISVLACSAERHLDLALTTVQDFEAAGQKSRFSRLLNFQEENQKERRAKMCAPLMLAYSQIALHAPKQLLCSRVETVIVENILCQYRSSSQDLELKLALIRSVTEVSCAIQSVSNGASFNFSSKRVLLAILLSLYRRCLGALGQLMTTLEEDLTSSWLKESFHLLEAWLHSEKEWERERALQVCTQLMQAYAERFVSTVSMGSLFPEACGSSVGAAGVSRGRNTMADLGESTVAQFGYLTGVLGPLTCDSLVTSRQQALNCISCLLSAQAEVLHVKKDEMNHFCEELSATDADSLLKTSSKIAKTACQYIPWEQARDFMQAVLGSMLSFSPACAMAAGKWMIIFLQQRGREILPEVPGVLTVLYDHLPACRQNNLKEIVLEAVFALAYCHPQAVANSLLQRHLPMDSDTAELWRTLGRSFLATQVLQLLMDRLESAETTRSRRNCPDDAVESSEAALEPLAVTCAISELVSAMRTLETVPFLLPRLLPMLMKQISDTLGKEMPSPPGRAQEELVLVACGEDSRPCRLSIRALDAVLCKCIDERWMRVLGKQRTWAFLENPQASQEGTCLLTSVLLRAGVITRVLVNAVFPWLDSPSANLRTMATAFFAELMKHPVLEERKLLRPVLSALVDKTLDASSAVRQMAVRGLGNLASGAPEELRKHQEAIVEVLLRATKDATAPQIIGESLSALAKVVAELKEKGLGVSFRDIALCTKTFFDADEAVLRSSAFTLYGMLASSAKRKRRSFLSQELQTTWVRILLHLRDPDPGVYNARNVPELLESVYDTLRTYFWSSCWGMRTAAVKLTGVILENADARWLREQDMSSLSRALQLLQEDQHASVQQAAAQVLGDNWPELSRVPTT